MSEALTCLSTEHSAIFHRSAWSRGDHRGTWLTPNCSKPLYRCSVGVTAFYQRVCGCSILCRLLWSPCLTEPLNLCVIDSSNLLMVLLPSVSLVAPWSSRCSVTILKHGATFPLAPSTPSLTSTLQQQDSIYHTRGRVPLFSVEGHLDIYDLICGPYKIIYFEISLVH